MSRTRIISIALGALLALTGLAASNAQAEGPLWLIGLHLCKKVAHNTGPEYFTTLHNCTLIAGPAEGEWKLENLSAFHLGSGTTLNETSNNVSGNVAKLVGSGTTIECSSVSDTGTVKGGAPGKDESTITFTGCKVEGKTENQCHVKGNSGEPIGTIVVSNAKTELVYTGTEAQAKSETGPIGDLFLPASGTTFVTIDLESNETPSGCKTTGLVKVKGSVVSETSPAPGTTALKPTLKFPASPINKAYQWVSHGVVNKVEPELIAFGSSKAVQVGEEEVELEQKELAPNEWDIYWLGGTDS